MTLSEDVLRDLLLEHGIEGVTLWHIKALAAYLHGMKVCGTQYYPVQRLDSDLRGEGPVVFEAENTNRELDEQRKYRPSGGDCDHDFIATPDGEACTRCGGTPPRSPGEYELDEPQYFDGHD